MDEGMTLTEIVRLIDWLTANGHSEKDALECIKFIAAGDAMARQGQ